MVGLVLVSHSRLVADGAAELARQMGGADVAIVAAGGLEDGSIGTDAVRVADAIRAAMAPEGVLVLMDLGSAVLSAELALDLLAEGRERVRLVPAPLVEGAVAAAVAARAGAALDEVAAEAAGGLAGKEAHLGASTGATVTVAIPHGLHARPAARLVRLAAGSGADVRVRNATTGRGPVTARSLNAVATLGILQGHVLEITAGGPGARGAVDALVALAGRGFDERPETDAPVARGAVPEGAIAGLPASPGVVVAVARRFHAAPIPVPTTPPEDAAAERAALARAMDATRAALRAQRDGVARRSGEAAAAIFDAHLLFLDDEAVVAPALDAVAGGASAAVAWRDAIDAAAAGWAELGDPYLRARADDLRSVGAQVLANLLGVPLPAPRLAAPGVLVAADLSPADAAALDPATVLGVATGAGGPTSHAAVITRSLGIPAVVGIGPALDDVPDGSEVALDGEAGYLLVRPDEELRASLEDRRDRERRARERAVRAAAEPGATRDGVPVEVAANIGGPAEVAAALAAGCDGVGLFRTELLFLERADLPGEEEQEAAYRAAAAALGGRPLVIRTLDVGADKPVPALRQEPEANPFLGLRGIRLGLARPDLLAAQLRAIVRVARDHRVRLLFPMVATREELLAARAALDAARASAGDAPLEIGVMVEVPSAAIAADRLAPHVDFFSIGTNDLTQYVFAAERGNDRVAAIADPFHPALLDLIGRTARASAAAGGWTGVCGELAADPLAAPLLVGLGVRELSMGAPAIPLVKAALRAVDLDDATALARDALACGSGEEVRALLRGRAGGPR